MELKLVYRVLRKISDWTLGGFYSEVHVEGQENVGGDGPLIIASTHHNEIIDIATLAATIPHRRHLSFWAKSSMFANPLAGAILFSSGAIPVRRNPNHGSSPSSSASTSILSMSTSSSTGTSTPSDTETTTATATATATASATTHPPQRNTTGTPGAQSSLFRETSHALAKGGVIGVFPEGTSYTQPGIVQVMSGAAWAAVDYVRSAREWEWEGKELTIVPVAIVYTDKARYQSRVSVRYGAPIPVARYTDGMFCGDEDEDLDAAARGAVKDMMGEVERQMRAMSVNAPDWDTLYAAQMAREILWTDPDNIPLKDWVSLSQTLVTIFTDPGPSSQALDRVALAAAKAALTKYYALLHYTSIEHSILTHLLPSPFLPFRLLHPLRALLSLLLFTPPLLVHIPAYVAGSLAGRYLAAPGEEEARAQFKAVFGGVGLGAGLGVLVRVLGRGNVRWLEWLPHEGGVKRIVGVLGVAYASVWLLVKWHNALVRGNYKRLKTLLTLYKLCLGLLVPHVSLRKSELEGYTRPPPPPPNPFIKKHNKDKDMGNSNGNGGGPRSGKADTPRPAGMASSSKLIRPLLAARAEAVSALGEYLMGRGGDDGLVGLLRGKGARVDAFDGKDM